MVTGQPTVIAGQASSIVLDTLSRIGDAQGFWTGYARFVLAAAMVMQRPGKRVPVTVLCKQILTWPENPGRRGRIIGGSSAEEAIRLTIQSIMADVQAAAHKAQNGTEGGLSGKMADVSCRCVSVR